MRRYAALHTCVGLLTAFVLAPFQHIHTGSGPGMDHDHAGLIHAHFYHLLAPRTNHTGPQFDDDDDRAVRPVDTFKLVLTTSLAPFIPSRALALLFVPAPALQSVAVVEERGHDPPSTGPLIPRAPPA